jgi:imidazole glycerol-phosphate synthase subunit HisF
LLKTMSEIVDIPLIASGGMGTLSHIDPLIESNLVDGIAIGTAFHYKKYTPGEVKTYLGYS